MSRRLRAALLLALALVLGGLAALEVNNRETALNQRIGELVTVVEARTDLVADKPIRSDQLALRKVPARFTPSNVAATPDDVVGLKPLVTIHQGSFISGDQFGADNESEHGSELKRGERIAEVVAAGDPEMVVAGTHVDVVVTRDSREDSTKGQSVLILQDVQVLDSAPMSDPTGDGNASGGLRVRVSLRVRLREAVQLAQAQNFAREIRLLARAPGDRATRPAFSVSG